MSLPSEPVEFPIWRGRRGLINTAICGVLGVLCALGLAWFAERRVVVPGCTAYGESRGMTYVDYKIYASARRGSGACRFITDGGSPQEVSFGEATSLVTDLWLGVAFALDFTVPVFVLLLALVRSVPYFVDARGEKRRVPERDRPAPK